MRLCVDMGGCGIGFAVGSWLLGGKKYFLGNIFSPLFAKIPVWETQKSVVSSTCMWG